MKFAGWVLVLAACASAPAPTPPAPALVSECPVSECPTCETPACPTCPECPRPPPEPATRDWHCMELDPPFKGVKTYCWPNAWICEYYREKTGKDTKNYGKPSACVTDPVAYCFYIKQYEVSNRQMRCARNMEDCQIRRKQTADEPPLDTMKTSACERALNLDDFTYKNTGDDLNP